VSGLESPQAREGRDRDIVLASPAWSHQLAWVIIGIGLDWRCAFEWFAGRSPFYSEPVLDRTVLIVLACAGAALLIVCFSRGVKLWFASALFLGLSALVYDLLSVHWTAHRR
jgi:hypothetical protein